MLKKRNGLRLGFALLLMIVASDAVRLIDVIWISPDGRAIAAFEVEHTTSIYSGIVRLLDLALGSVGAAPHGLFLVAPDKREDDVRTQLATFCIQSRA